MLSVFVTFSKKRKKSISKPLSHCRGENDGNSLKTNYNMNDPFKSKNVYVQCIDIHYFR